MWIDEQILSRCDQSVFFKVWVPEKTCVVVGNANNPNKEVYLERCKKDKIKVYRRSGGGGTVVLHPNNLILSLGCWVDSYYKNKEYFLKINQAVISTLEQITSCSQLSQKGLSDICYKDKKLAGTSLFRSRNYLLYQASILYISDIEKISYYLPHPSSEPSYREKKSHKNFLTSLREISDCSNLESVCKDFRKRFANNFYQQMLSDLIVSQKSQTLHLLKRSKRIGDLTI